MKRPIQLAILLLATVSLASAKDRQYETGTVERLTSAVQADTTDCYHSSVTTVSCTGDSHDVYVTVYFLTLADGRRLHISHVLFSRDPVKALDFSKGAVTVQYRIERKMGGDSAAIVDPSDPKKEGWYGFDALKVRQ